MKSPALSPRPALLAGAAAALLFAGCSSMKLRKESGPPLAATPVTFVPETVAEFTVTAAVPLELSVMVCVDDVFTVALPKLSDDAPIVS